MKIPNKTDLLMQGQNGIKENFVRESFSLSLAE